jgi:hypothetical protein
VNTDADAIGQRALSATNRRYEQGDISPTRPLPCPAL